MAKVSGPNIKESPVFTGVGYFCAVHVKTLELLLTYTTQTKSWVFIHVEGIQTKSIATPIYKRRQ